MKNITYLIIYLIASLLINNVTFSQNFDNNFLFRNADSSSNIVNTNWQFDPSIFVYIGYGKLLQIAEKKVEISASVGSPIFLLKSFDNISLTIDGSTFLLKDKWNIKSKLGFKYDFFDNTLSKGGNFSTYISVMPGYFTKKWFAGIDILYRQQFLTYMKHHDTYKQNFPEATEGWYENRAGFFYFSAKGGYLFHNKIETTIRVSYKMPKTLQSYPPFSVAIAAGIGINYYF